MRRRQLLASIGGAALVPLWARAQEANRTYRLAYFGSLSWESPPQRAFLQALGELGYVKGKNLELDTNGSGLRPGQYAGVAQRLVEAKPDLIICGGSEPAKAAQHATNTIPLLVVTDDMVGEGLVASIVNPGGNTTGVSILSPQLDGKRLEILLELLPGAHRVDALAGSDTANKQHFDELQSEARARGVEMIIRTSNAYSEIAPAIEAAKAAGAVGLNVLGSALLFGNREVIFERASALALPAIYQWPENAHEGGLIGYGPSIVRIYEKQLSRMAAEIFRGTRPADIPIEHPTRFYLAVNLKTAKALDLVPQSLIQRADEVIE